MTNEKISIKKAMNDAYFALCQLSKAWTNNTEGINLNESDTVLESYPFSLDLDEIISLFSDMQYALCEELERTPKHTYIVRHTFYAHDTNEFVDAENIASFAKQEDAKAYAQTLNRTAASAWEALPGIWEYDSYSVLDICNDSFCGFIEACKLDFVKPSKG